ncbi:chloride channel protein [Faecalibacterium hattorii]|uniref:chloride channel protein n=1 Tax=Faecalibacterium hattorii TaxID=2935520 RepID=UPI003AAA5D40
MEHTVPKLLPNPWVRVFAGGVLVVGFSYLFGVGRYNGAGMSVITAAVEQGQALPWDFLCKIFLTALTLACGFKGGEVVPSFFVVGPSAAWSARCWVYPPNLRRRWGWCPSSAVPPTSLSPSCWALSCSAAPGWSSSRWAAVSASCFYHRPVQQPDLCYQQAALGVYVPQVARKGEKKRKSKRLQTLSVTPYGVPAPPKGGAFFATSGQYK